MDNTNNLVQAVDIILFKALQFIAALSILVFVHELGHFMWARIFKVRVEKFYLFFDTKSFAFLRWKPRGSDTEYGIGWIPLGGYCAISGMVDETHDAGDLGDKVEPWEFRAKGPFARFMIMFGGVLNNIILACIIYICLVWNYGYDKLELQNLKNGMVYSEYAQSIGFQNGDIICEIDGEIAEDNSFRNSLLLGCNATVLRNGERVDIIFPDTIGQVFLRDQQELINFAMPRFPMVIAEAVEGGPAFLAGLQTGDSIVGVEGIKTQYVDEVKAMLAKQAGDTTAISFYRGDSLMIADLVVKADSTIGVMLKPGITEADYTHIDFSLAEAIPAGISRGWEMLYNYVRQFKLVFTKEGAQSLGGFGTMGSVFPETWSWMTFWSITAFFSVALAFMNILPIPGLDGGHIFILIIETIIRRPISDKAKEIAMYIGFGLIIALMLFANGNDIWRFIIKPFVS
ncbi:MAG: RIP metalloprotease RseP [Bacteroidales bacterium]|nr:RIP metalloprotease RseP [Bacteroidales bacterium]